MKKVLCVSTNKQDVLNMLPVVNDLKSRISVGIKFFNTDTIYQQGIQQILSDQTFIQPYVFFKKPFYQMNEIERLINTPALFRLSKITEEFDGVILGGFGVLEYRIAKYLKKTYSTKVFLLIDSILLYPERYILKKRIRKIIYGIKSRQNICDAIFVSGDATKETLVCDDVKKEIIFVSGLPRFRQLFVNYDKRTIGQNKIKILFLTGGFAWHGQYLLENNERIMIRSLVKLQKEMNQDIKLSIKIHPRTYWGSDFNIDPTIEIISGQSNDVYSIINEYDIIISAQQISTLLFESLWLNKMCIYVEPSDKYKLTRFEKLEKSVVICKSFDELKRCIEDIVHHRAVDKLFGSNKEYYISSKSKDSTQYISHYIEHSLST